MFLAEVDHSAQFKALYVIDSLSKSILDVQPQEMRDGCRVAVKHFFQDLMVLLVFAEAFNNVERDRWPYPVFEVDFLPWYPVGLSPD